MVSSIHRRSAKRQINSSTANTFRGAYALLRNRFRAVKRGNNIFPICRFGFLSCEHRNRSDCYSLPEIGRSCKPEIRPDRNDDHSRQNRRLETPRSGGGKIANAACRSRTDRSPIAALPRFFCRRHDSTIGNNPYSRYVRLHDRVGRTRPSFDNEFGFAHRCPGR